MYRKDPFWDVVKYMIYKIIYLFENAQSPAIAGLFYKIRENLYVLIDCYEQNEKLIQSNHSIYKALLLNICKCMNQKKITYYNKK